MLLTELREGTHVFTADGKDLGKIERFVVDPSDYHVTHVVIGKGVFLPQERVAPVDALATADRDDQLRLKSSISADDLPPFEEHHYLDMGMDLPDQADAAMPYPASTWAYPTVALAGFPAYPTIGAPAMAVDTTRNVPEGSLVVNEGTEVISGDGETIGKVKEVGTDESGELAYVIVDPGWFRSERLIPGHWVTNIDSMGVHLSLSTEALRRHDRDRS